MPAKKPAARKSLSKAEAMPPAPAPKAPAPKAKPKRRGLVQQQDSQGRPQWTALSAVSYVDANGRRTLAKPGDTVSDAGADVSEDLHARGVLAPLLG